MDLEFGRIVNLYDFSAMAAEWMTLGCAGAGDFTVDGSVNMEDLAEVLMFWLEECQSQPLESKDRDCGGASYSSSLRRVRAIKRLRNSGQAETGLPLRTRGLSVSRAR